MVLRSPAPDIELPKDNFGEFVLKYMRRYEPDEITFVDTDKNKSYTRQEMMDCFKKCASAFYRMGIRKGDVVALCLANCPEMIMVTVGALLCGGVVANNNPLYTERELAHQLGLVRPKLVFGQEENYDLLVKVCAKLPSVQAIITIEDGSSPKTFSRLIAHGRVEDYPINVHVKPDDSAFIFFSSGTTGMPKGVVHSHQTYSLGIIVTSCSLLLREKLRLYGIVPMFHTLGAIMAYWGLIAGNVIYLRRRLDFAQLLQDVAKYKISYLPAAPPLIVGLDQVPTDLGIDLSSLKLISSGGASMPVAAAHSVMKKYDVRINQGYGMTEAAPMLYAYDFLTPVDSAGSVTPNMLLKIVDTKTDRELGLKEDGEICVKGPLIMKGYLKNPKATAECIDPDGWLHTGDIGHYDENGYVYVVGRTKELIKYKAFQVAPAELDDLLLSHPKVADAAVIGIPDPSAGEVPKAFVVAKDDSLTENELHEFVKDKVVKYKYLRGGITFVDEIPKSPSGKILRRVLRDMEDEARRSKV